MDYIREFDIKLEKEYYYPGEVVSGTVLLDTVENFKLRSKLITLIKKLLKSACFLAIRILLRGKAHAEWKVLLSGDRRTVSAQLFIEFISN